MTKSKIELNIELDDNKIPERLNWSAEDGGVTSEEAKSFLLSVWDSENFHAFEQEPYRPHHRLGPGVRRRYHPLLTRHSLHDRFSTQHL